MTVLERLQRLEALIDQCEYKVVLCMGVAKERRQYWKRTRPIRRGSIGEPK